MSLRGFKCKKGDDQAKQLLIEDRDKFIAKHSMLFDKIYPVEDESKMGVYKAIIKLAKDCHFKPNQSKKA